MSIVSVGPDPSAFPAHLEPPDLARLRELAAQHPDDVRIHLLGEIGGVVDYGDADPMRLEEARNFGRPGGPAQDVEEVPRRVPEAGEKVELRAVGRGVEVPAGLALLEERNHRLVGAAVLRRHADAAAFEGEY